MAKDKCSRSKPLLTNSLSQTRNPTTDSAVTSKRKKDSVKWLDNHSTAHTSKKQKAGTTSTVKEKKRKKDSSKKTVPTMRYESELERTLRLQMENMNESHKKLSKSSNTLKNNNTQSESLRQRLTSIKHTSNAISNTNLSQSKLKIKIPFPLKGIEVSKPHVNSSLPPKQKTVKIWKFHDGTTAKKVY